MPLFVPDPTYAVLQAHPRKRRARGWVAPGTSGPTTPPGFLNDPFSDADGATLDAHTPTVGGSWSKHGGWTGVGTIQTNRVWFGATEGHYASAGTPAGADYVVTADAVFVSLVTNAFAGTMARMQAGANTAYMAFPFYDGSTVNIYLKRIVAGTGTNIANTLVTLPTVGSVHSLDLMVQGSVLTALWDGVAVVGPITDTNIAAAGSAGVFGQIGSTSTGIHLDNVIARDLLAATSRGSSVVSTVLTTWATTTNAFDGAVGSTPATYATWVNAANGAAGAITIGGYTFTGPTTSSVIKKVVATIRHIESNTTNISTVTVQLQDSTGANIGSAVTATKNTVAHSDTLVLGTPTAAQVVAGLRVLVTITRGANTTSTTFSLDYVDLEVDYAAA